VCNETQNSTTTSPSSLGYQTCQPLHDAAGGSHLTGPYPSHRPSTIRKVARNDESNDATREASHDKTGPERIMRAASEQSLRFLVEKWLAPGPSVSRSRDRIQAVPVWAAGVMCGSRLLRKVDRAAFLSFDTTTALVCVSTTADTPKLFALPARRLAEAPTRGDWPGPHAS